MTSGADFHRVQLYSAAQVRDLDARAIDTLRIPGYTLMQRAARASFDALRARWPHAQHLAVLCGPGNNGGDGYEIARLARTAGWNVQLAQVGKAPVRGDAVTARAAWLAEGGSVAPWSVAFAQGPLRSAQIVCDAIFGIGITREVQGAAREAIEALNARSPQQDVIAIDLPSGLDADTGAIHGAAVRADLTVSFIGRKLGLYTGQGPDVCGERVFADLGLPAAFLDGAPGLAELLDERELRAHLPRRARSAHKGRHGHVLIIGGEQGMAGAALLAARGALRAGAGLVSVATRAAHAVALTMAQPEAMVRGVESAAALEPLIEACDVIALGPGLGRETWARDCLQRVLASTKPRVLDADALNLLAEAPRDLGADTVLTPHPAEAARLLGISTAQVQADRVAATAALRARYGATVLLKGVGTLVRGEQLALCADGNPGMGTGGMGDVLTGVIAALRGQGLPAEAAARVGALAHARAGYAAAVQGERGLLPSDLLDHLRAVLNPA
jgi:NAD(P)H-hydrate epimerase